MIARIAGDARISQFCDQRSLRLNGNCLFTFASDPCVNSDPSDRDRKCSISAIAAILASTDFLMETECHGFRRSRPPSQVISLFLFTSMGIKVISIPFKLLGKTRISAYEMYPNLFFFAKTVLPRIYASFCFDGLLLS